MSVTEELSRYSSGLSFSDLPKSVVKATKKVTLDVLGCALAGSGAAGCKTVAKMVKNFGGRNESTIIAYGGKVPAPMAAITNGTLAHALDFDDTHDLAVLHTSAPVISAALALAERERVSGKELITAATVGMDVHCRMGLACTYDIHRYGWIYSSTMGYFGAAVAAGKILGLNEEEMRNAIGIAYSETAGNLQVIPDGALAKRLQLGLAAKGGVLAALLAQAGFTGPRHALEGKYGFYNVYQRGEYVREKLLERLGKEFEVTNLSLKPYPSCRATHASIDAALEARRRYNIKPEDVDHIEVRVPKKEYALTCDPIEVKYNPQTVVDLQFNIPYTVACALIKDSVLIEDFTRKALKREHFFELARKVKPMVDEELEKALVRGISPITMKLSLKNGQEYTVNIKHPRGHPQNPLTMEEVREKFEKCSESVGFPREKISKLASAIENLEGINDVADLEELLTGAKV